jgi:hypothetical protein
MMDFTLGAILLAFAFLAMLAAIVAEDTAREGPEYRMAWAAGGIALVMGAAGIWVMA